jgi:hypothetical protein
VLGKIFGTKQELVKEGCRKLHDEQLQYLKFSPKNIRLFKSKGG